MSEYPVIFKTDKPLPVEDVRSSLKPHIGKYAVVIVDYGNGMSLRCMGRLTRFGDNIGIEEERDLSVGLEPHTKDEQLAGLFMYESSGSELIKKPVPNYEVVTPPIGRYL